MNFDFSDDQKQLRDQARKFLTEKCSSKAVRVVLDGKAPYDKELWKGLAEMGFLGVAITEELGGAGAELFRKKWDGPTRRCRSPRPCISPPRRC